MKNVVVLKLGGELLEEDRDMRATARRIVAMAKHARLVVVHGGGKEVDAALAQAAIPKHQVDGLRVTDEATLQVVVAVLAGSVNTRLVAAINGAGGRAVGLTAADAGVTEVAPARLHRATNGELVDLGKVGEPVNGRGAPLLKTLVKNDFVPVLACIGAGAGGQLYNVNADTLAGNVAARLKAMRLVIAGGTGGVLDKRGRTIKRLESATIDELISSGTATAGMVAKLRACVVAKKRGVKEITIADGRSPKLTALVAGKARDSEAWTRLA